MIKSRVVQVLAALAFAPLAAAGTQVTAQAVPVQTTSAAQAQRAASKPQASAAARLSITLFVTDLAGEAAEGVRAVMTGPVSREGTTGRDGRLRFQTLRAGTYRLRFESPDFVTFEREVTVKAGPVAEFEVALSPAPEPPPTQPPAPVQAAPTEPAPVAPNPDATVDLLELPDWIERNLIGRSDPQRETVVGRAPGATARVVQIREPTKDRARSDADEMLYVIAGEGVLRAKGRAYDLTAGSFAVVPRGVAYTLERRGRNPLVALSMVSK